MTESTSMGPVMPVPGSTTKITSPGSTEGMPRSTSSPRYILPTSFLSLWQHIVDTLASLLKGASRPEWRSKMPLPDDMPEDDVLDGWSLPLHHPHTPRRRRGPGEEE